MGYEASMIEYVVEFDDGDTLNKKVFDDENWLKAVKYAKSFGGCLEVHKKTIIEKDEMNPWEYDDSDHIGQAKIQFLERSGLISEKEKLLAEELKVKMSHLLDMERSKGEFNNLMIAKYALYSLLADEEETIENNLRNNPDFKNQE